MAILSLRYISFFCFFWRCFLFWILFDEVFWGSDGLIFKEDIIWVLCVLDSNFSDFLREVLLFMDELEFIEDVSFIIFEEFNEGEDMLLLILLFALLLFIGERNEGIFSFEFKSLIVLFMGLFI